MMTSPPVAAGGAGGAGAGSAGGSDGGSAGGAGAGSAGGGAGAAASSSPPQAAMRAPKLTALTPTMNWRLVMDLVSSSLLPFLGVSTWSAISLLPPGKATQAVRQVACEHETPFRKSRS